MTIYFFDNSHLLIVSRQTFNHPLMKIISQVVTMLTVILVLILLLRLRLVIMTLFHRQQEIMILLVDFLQLGRLVLIGLVILEKSYQTTMEYLHLKILGLAVILEVLNHRRVLWLLLTLQILLLMVIVIISNHIHYNKHLPNRIKTY